jgi:hypothetical protein
MCRVRSLSITLALLMLSAVASGCGWLHDDSECGAPEGSVLHIRVVKRSADLPDPRDPPDCESLVAPGDELTATVLSYEDSAQGEYCGIPGRFALGPHRGWTFTDQTTRSAPSGYNFAQRATRGDCQIELSTSFGDGRLGYSGGSGCTRLCSEAWIVEQWVEPPG